MTVAKRIYILGIDPGSVITGYGLIESDGNYSQHIANGAIKTGNGSFTERLGVISSELTEVIQRWQPEQVAIEDVFISNNAASALKLGQARGAAIAACRLQQLPVAEYATRLIKQNVVGTGAASKTQVQHMVRHLLALREPLQTDAADALAVAVCHAHCMQHQQQIKLPVARIQRKSRLLPRG